MAEAACLSAMTSPGPRPSGSRAARVRSRGHKATLTTASSLVRRARAAITAVARHLRNPTPSSVALWPRERRAASADRKTGAPSTSPAGETVVQPLDPAPPTPRATTAPRQPNESNLDRTRRNQGGPTAPSSASPTSAAACAVHRHRAPGSARRRAPPRPSAPPALPRLRPARAAHKTSARTPHTVRE
jgi:hypothetical protein